MNVHVERGVSRRRFLTGAGLVLGAAATRRTGWSSETPTIVHCPSGMLRGSAAGGARVFRGVPFAQPPVGSLRFRPPAASKPWTGIRDATSFAPAAMQPGLRTQSEDCLYLNIWAPEGTGPFPVLVWIHGGGFTGGGAAEPLFDGTEFARAGIVSITVPYRLGVFGFLDMEPLLGAQYAGSANNALRDLIAALEWIQGNIGAFGGDPGRVTIGGQSAGAKLTGLLMGVPSAEGLFHGMISDSGGAERVWPGAQSTVVAEGFGAAWRGSTNTKNQALLTSPASLLIQTQTSFMDNWPQHFPLRAQLDGSGEDALLPRLPVATIAGGSTRGKRLLIGTNREESAFFLGPHPAADPRAADLGNLPLDAFDTVFAQYKTLYPQMTPQQLRIRAVTAEEYWIPSIRVAEAHVKGGGTAWMYRLDFTEAAGHLAGYAYHSLDMPLVWDHPHTQFGKSAAEAALATQVHTAWAAFLLGEAPAAAGLPAWPQYSLDTRSTMVLNTVSHVEQRPQDAELRLWNGVL